MNITWPKGKLKISLSKGDRNQMTAVKNLCARLAINVNGQVQGAALTVEAGLAKLLAEFGDDAAESEPEAATGNGATGMADKVHQGDRSHENPVRS